MKNPLIPFTIALMMLAPVTFAQETTPATETAASDDTAAKPESPKTATDEEFPVAADEPAENQGYLKSKNGEWEARCLKSKDEKPEICRIYNLLRDKDGNTVAELNMQALPKGGKAIAGVDIATPLGSLLPAQVVMKVDAGKAKRYPYTWCDTFGCFARFGMTKGEIDALKKGAKVVVTIVSVAEPNTPINLDVSLSGFTAAWNDIELK